MTARHTKFIGLREDKAARQVNLPLVISGSALHLLRAAV